MTVQRSLYEQAVAFLHSHTLRGARSRRVFSTMCRDRAGMIDIPWCGRAACEAARQGEPGRDDAQLRPLERRRNRLRGVRRAGKGERLLCAVVLSIAALVVACRDDARVGARLVAFGRRRRRERARGGQSDRPRDAHRRKRSSRRPGPRK